MFFEIVFSGICQGLWKDLERVFKGLFEGFQRAF